MGGTREFAYAIAANIAKQLTLLGKAGGAMSDLELGPHTKASPNLVPGSSAASEQNEPFEALSLFVVGNKLTSKRWVCRLFGWDTERTDEMTRLLAFTALALSVGIAPVLAQETSTQPSGSADTSGVTSEQSSSPPSAGSLMGKMGEKNVSPPATPSTSSKMKTPDQTTPNPSAPSSGD